MFYIHLDNIAKELHVQTLLCTDTSMYHSELQYELWDASSLQCGSVVIQV